MEVGVLLAYADGYRYGLCGSERQKEGTMTKEQKKVLLIACSVILLILFLAKSSDTPALRQEKRIVQCAEDLIPDCLQNGTVGYEMCKDAAIIVCAKEDEEKTGEKTWEKTK